MNTEHIVETGFTPAPSRIGRAVTQWLEANSGQLRQWRHRANTRRQLLSMTDRELDDIGVSWAEAQQEAAKPFWEA